jgi:predicted helicase
MKREEIFSQVFDNSDFHRHNNVAKQLYALEETFFAGSLKQKTLAGLRPYYAAIKSAAALVSSHHEKQNFLKVIYENFYKVYDKKKADRLGVAYAPNEIVRFMVEGADWLCQKHFDKALIDKNVEIRDPCVGTGTFITEMIEHFRGQPTKLRYKYLEELHCNEVAILPYYVANLNIEATYATIVQNYEEYPNLCFVDTLDNTAKWKPMPIDWRWRLPRDARVARATEQARARNLDIFTHHHRRYEGRVVELDLPPVSESPHSPGGDARSDRRDLIRGIP